MQGTMTIVNMLLYIAQYFNGERVGGFDIKLAICQNFSLPTVSSSIADTSGLFHKVSQ